MAKQERVPASLVLQRADKWREGGQIAQAIHTYLMLMDYHSESEEAEKARERLMELALWLEEQGKVYQALTLYQRLGALT